MPATQGTHSAPTTLFNATTAGVVIASADPQRLGFVLVNMSDAVIWISLDAAGAGGVNAAIPLEPSPGTTPNGETTPGEKWECTWYKGPLRAYHGLSGNKPLLVTVTS